MGILVKLKDTPRLRSRVSTSGTVESPPGRFPGVGGSVSTWNQKATCPRASETGQRSSLGVRRQPSGSGHGQPLPRGSESALRVWPVSGLLGPEGEDKLPHQRVAGRPGDSQTWGLTDVGAAGAMTEVGRMPHCRAAPGSPRPPLGAREGPRTGPLPRRPVLAQRCRRNQRSALFFGTP